MTDVDGGSVPEEQDTLLVRTSQKRSTTIMVSHLLRERINWLWRDTIGVKTETLSRFSQVRDNKYRPQHDPANETFSAKLLLPLW